MALGIGDQFCLRWNNYHCNMTSVINQLLAEEAFVDVTLACDGARIKAHRVVLSACSPYFQRVLLDNPCKHPVLILPVGVGHADLRAIVEFIYRGETYVTRDQLSSIVRVAELLKIKGLCEVSQQQNETQSVGTTSMSSQQHGTGQQQPLVAEQHHQQNAGHIVPLMNSGSYVNDAAMTTVLAAAAAASLGVPNNTSVVSMATMTQPLGQLVSTSVSQQQTGRPTYSPSYRGRPRGRRSSGTASATGRGGWTGTGEKRSAASAGLNAAGGVRRPTRGTYRGSWPSNRSPSKASPTGSNLSAAHGNNSQDSVDMVQDSDSMLVQTSQSLQGNPGGGDGSYQQHGGGGNPSSSNTPVHSSAPSSLDSQTQTAASLYGDAGRDYSSPVGALDHLPSPWQHHLNQHPSHSFTPSPGGGNSNHHHQQQDRSFKSEPEHVGGGAGGSGFPHGATAVRSEAVNDSDRNGHDDGSSGGGVAVTPEILALLPPHITALHHHHHQQGSTDGSISNNNGTPVVDGGGASGSGETPTKKMYTPEAMEAALDALRIGSMSLTRAAAAFGIPSTTLWQRAHRLGIDTPMKKDPSSRHWSEDDLRLALDALRAGRISANRASKEYGIPSSTLYKIARKEGIKLAAPFNASPTTWSPDDLGRALEAIRGGMSVQRAATQFGIPSGTLYGRCKREGIELVHKQSFSADRPWSDTNMTDAMEAVRQGEMSINQAAIHFNVPYSSLYNRIKRIKAAEEAGESYEAALAAEGGPPPDDGDVYEDDLDEEDAMMIAASSGGASGGITPSPTHQQHTSGGLGEQQHSTGPSPSAATYAGVVPAYLAGHVPVMTLPGVMTSAGTVVPLTMDTYQAYAQQQQQQHSAPSASSGSSGNSSGGGGQPSSAATYQQ